MPSTRSRRPQPVVGCRSLMRFGRHHGRRSTILFQGNDQISFFFGVSLARWENNLFRIFPEPYIYADNFEQMSNNVLIHGGANSGTIMPIISMHSIPGSHTFCAILYIIATVVHTITAIAAVELQSLQTHPPYGTKITETSKGGA